jgi:MFS family permease
MSRRAIIILTVASLIITLSAGVRQSFGLYLPYVTMDLGVGREVFGFAMAIQNIITGMMMPLAGALGERYGVGRVTFIAGLVYVAGLLLASMANGPLMLYASLGLLVGVGLGAVTYNVLFAAVGQAVPADKRTFAFGIVTGAGSFGMFALMPATGQLLEHMSWNNAMLVVAALPLIVALLAFALPWRPLPAVAGKHQTLGEALREARGHSGYLLLNAGFFVCGFHVTFIGTHFPAFLRDSGVDSSAASWAFSLIGFFNIIGSIAFGAMGGFWRKKYVLSALYFARAIAIALFILMPVTELSAYLFAAAIGFMWLGTVPLTSGLVSQIFGMRYLATLAGIVSFFHQVGAFLGAWLGGKFYDMTGSYDIVWMIAIALGIFAAVVHLPIADAPLARLKAQPA